MTAAKSKTVIGNRVVSLTRFVMAQDNVPQDVAYAKLYGTEFFLLLSDPETRLFLEDDDYLKAAYCKETSESVEAMYDFIRPEV